MVSCLKSSLEKRLSRHFLDENYIMSWSAIYVPSIKLHWRGGRKTLQHKKIQNWNPYHFTKWFRRFITTEKNWWKSAIQLYDTHPPPKNYHSIIVQGICKNKLRFMNIVSKWPGSTHDSFILRISAFVWEWCRSRRLAFWE